ncbi:MBL fold metallo-hydrolase [Patescibacteria group bacterium]|nr:MBL fold metallo-hydrolase [Patescibacteria group bacterium]
MNKTIFFITLIILSALFFSFYRIENKLAINFLDVGQGDAILIRTPDGQNILIDGGPDNLLLSQMADKLPWWEDTIDYLIITHWHDDHMMGFVELLEKYEVKHVLVSNHQPDHFLYNIFTQKLQENNIQPQIVQAGESFMFSDDLYFRVLLADYWHEDFNENSVVIKLSYKDKNVLLMGDLPIEGEQKLLSGGFDLNSQYLKVGHHGSKYSSSLEFLQAVQPEFCIIQSGLDNKFGHPHQEAIERLKKVGCEIENTQDLGTISFSF